MLLMQCLQHPSTRAWLYWSGLFLICATIELPEVTAARRSARASRIDDGPWQLHSSGFSGPAAQALAQLAEGPLNATLPFVEWRHKHEQYVKRVTVMEATGKPWQFVFYGDATVEALRGTYVSSSSRLDLKASFWDSYFQSLNAAWFGIAENGISQLAFRLLDGEFPKKHAPAVVVLAIGNKDLLPPRCNRAQGDAVKEGWRRIIEFIREQAPSTHILALGHLPEVLSQARLLPDVCTELIRGVDSYLENLANSMDHVRYVELESLLPSVLQGATEEDELPLKRVTYLEEDRAAEVSEHYVLDFPHQGTWPMDVVFEHVSEAVAEVLGQSVPSPSEGSGQDSPSAGSGQDSLAGAADARTQVPRSRRARGRAKYVHMQVESEVLSQPQVIRVIYKRADMVSEEEASLHEDT